MKSPKKYCPISSSRISPSTELVSSKNIPTTVNSFRLRHLDLLPELFTQIVFLCVELDMVDLQILAIDGQKIQAAASFRKSKNLKGLKKEYAKVQKGIRKLVE
ncbi:MAG TPA: hypothetical protein ENI27_01405 [bacterium]|nr:hypothetical protein [bacterium]